MRSTRVSSSLPLLTCAVAWLLGAVVVGCFAEAQPPPTYRYACATASECDEGEACIDELCQIPCTTATAQTDCPSAGSFAGCFNGVCASVCQLELDEPCPRPQTCVELPYDISAGGRGGAGPLGLCGTLCSAGDGRCPEGETCVGGFCVTSCMTANDCGQGFTCADGLCVPAG